MSLLHCPLCVGLALLSVLRAASHLTLVGLRLSGSQGRLRAWGSTV